MAPHELEGAVEVVDADAGEECHEHRPKSSAERLAIRVAAVDLDGAPSEALLFR